VTYHSIPTPVIPAMLKGLRVLVDESSTEATIPLYDRLDGFQAGQVLHTEGPHFMESIYASSRECIQRCLQSQ